MAVRIGVNPIGWTNDDLLELGEETPLEVCLAEARSAGYAGIELGRKFPRRAGELRPILARHGLALVSGWYGAELRAALGEGGAGRGRGSPDPAGRDGLAGDGLRRDQRQRPGRPGRPALGAAPAGRRRVAPVRRGAHRGRGASRRARRPPRVPPPHGHRGGDRGGDRPADGGDRRGRRPPPRHRAPDLRRRGRGRGRAPARPAHRPRPLQGRPARRPRGRAAAGSELSRRGGRRRLHGAGRRLRGLPRPALDPESRRRTPAGWWSRPSRTRPSPIP